MKKKDEIKVCLVGSSGGHLTHLYMLKPFWKDKNRFWVTFDKEDARSLLEGEKVYPCYFPTNRSIKALIKNTKIAWDVLHGLDGLPKSDVLKFLLEDNCSIVVRPSGTEPKLKTYISVSAENKEAAEKVEAEICKSAETYLK